MEGSGNTLLSKNSNCNPYR